MIQTPRHNGSSSLLKVASQLRDDSTVNEDQDREGSHDTYVTVANQSADEKMARFAGTAK